MHIENIKYSKGLWKLRLKAIESQVRSTGEINHMGTGLSPYLGLDHLAISLSMQAVILSIFSLTGAKGELEEQSSSYSTRYLS